MPFLEKGILIGTFGHPDRTVSNVRQRNARTRLLKHNVSIGMARLVLQPQQTQRYMLVTLLLAMDRVPVGNGTPRSADAGCREQRPLQRASSKSGGTGQDRQLRRERPAQVARSPSDAPCCRYRQPSGRSDPLVQIVPDSPPLRAPCSMLRACCGKLRTDGSHVEQIFLETRFP